MKQLYVYILFAIIGLFFKAEKAIAQQVTVDETTDKIAGDPIFSHGVGYAGTVMYDGEEIPWFVLSDVYISFLKDPENKNIYVDIDMNPANIS